MAHPQTLHFDIPAASGDVTRPRRLPAWLLSTVLHTGIIVLLALLVRLAPVETIVEPDRSVGVVLARADEGADEYFDEAAVTKFGLKTSSQSGFVLHR